MARASVLLSFAALACLATRAAAADEPDYDADVKPILARSCFRCHGSEKQESGLRLDTAGGARDGGYSGAAIVPGKSGESLLIHAVTGTGDATVMPPEGEGERLAEEEIARLRAWIDSGATISAEGETPGAANGRRSSDHWAFQPVVRPEPPSVERVEWVRNPIDAFILARLEQRSLAPAHEADRATLIRRVSLDLLGLPPSREEVEAFRLDNRVDAYERLVERLLASPHYGERWGRHWLDLARYADSNGYTIDSARSIWKYRDWVIAALNRDLPFDQFAIQQLAGDMLPNATLDERIATGFHRNTLKNEEGGTDPEQFRIEAVADRVATTGAVFLGLTIGCARCHDHKYDPLSQRDYYRFFAFFNNADEPSLQVPTDQQAKELPALAADIEQAETRLGMVDANAGTRQVEWEQKLAGRVGQGWLAVDPLEFHSASGARLSRLDDRSLLVDGERASNDIYTVEFDVPRGEPITAVRLEALTDDSLPNRGPGRARNGNFVLSEVTLAVVSETAAVADTADAATGSEVVAAATESSLAIASARADHSQKDYPVAAATDGDTATGWAINVERGSLNVDRAATFVLAEPFEARERAARLRITLRHDHRDAGYTLGRFRLSTTSAAAEAVDLPADVLAALAVAVENRSDAERELLRLEYQKHDPERIPLAQVIAELKERKKQLESSITTTLALAERAEPRQTTIHIRGDFLRAGAPVEPGVPEVFANNGEAVEPATRLDFARWLVDGRNPLTARVTVNRIWQQYFGVGLVGTENDFGTQGDRPTHPELLDWLASEFVAAGWSQKALHRLIVTSAAYRQSSRYRPELVSVDPDNKLLARQSRLRLDAEAIRDSALTASGLLSREIGGPGVYPPQPGGIYAFTQQVKYWKESEGADRFRRAMYTYFWRSSPYPFLTTFDVPDANTACTRRVRSNTPLQSLTLANDRAFQELARGLATRVIEHLPQGTDDVRIGYAVELCLARDPSASELARLRDFVNAQRESFAGDAPAAAAALGVSTEADAIDPSAVETAAWTALARVLLNLDEFVTRE